MRTRQALAKLSVAAMTAAMLSFPTLPAFAVLPIACPDVQGTNLEAFYQLDEGAGTSTTDATVYNNSGSLQNGPTWTATSAPLGFGSNPFALDFDGTDDFVLVSDTTGLPTAGGARTISLWMNQDAVTGQATLVSLGNGNNANQKFIVQVGTAGPDTYLFTDGINGANNITITGAEIPTTGAWHHVAFVMDAANNWSYYLDGAFVKSGTFSVPINTVTNQVELGSRHDVVNGFYDGKLDDVRIFDTALTGPEVAQIAAGCPTPTFDFGDAADPTFPTLLASNGARHVLGSGLFMGTSVDNEADGQPTANAKGDDNNGTDDEDGVTFGGPLIVSGTGSVTVVSSGVGFVDAWIDFDDNGTWAAGAEHILTSAPVVAGSNTFQFAVPAGVNSNTVVSRFRISTAGGLPTSGLAADGEVEDHTVTVAGKCNGLTPTIVGTENGDIINGTNGNDVIVSLDGGDIINARNGSDTVCSGEGADIVNGGNGIDWIDGEAGADILNGDEGNDTVSGGAGNDIVNGNNGNDTLQGNQGNDLINGNNGNDTINGGPDNDNCNGGAGLNTITNCAP